MRLLQNKMLFASVEGDTSGGGVPLTDLQKQQIRREAIEDKENRFQEERKKRLEALRNGEDLDTSETEKEEQVSDQEGLEDQVEKKEEENNDESNNVGDDDIDDSDDIDYFEDDEDDDDADSDDESDSNRSDDDDEEPRGEEEKQDSESASVKGLRKRIQEQGSLRKKAEARIVEIEAENEKLKEDLEEAQNQAKQVAAENVNWMKHKDVAPLESDFLDIAYNGATSIDDPDTQQNFYDEINNLELIRKYHDKISKAQTHRERLALDNEFKGFLSDEFPSDNPSLLLSTVQKAKDQWIKILDTVDGLKAKHQSNTLSMGVEEYKQQTAPYTEVISDLGNIDDEYLENNPDSIESIVGRKYRDDPDFKKKADKFKRMMSEFILGQRPLTQEEMDRIEARASAKGMSVKDYQKQRSKNYVEQRQKFINQVFYQEMATEDFDEMRRVYKMYLKNKASKKSIKKVAKTGRTTEVQNKKEESQSRKRLDLNSRPRASVRIRELS